MKSTTELSDKNSQAATKGVINGDNPYTPIAVAKDEAKLYCGSGRYNKKIGSKPVHCLKRLVELCGQASVSGNVSNLP
jgi:hypothetical protein